MEYKINIAELLKDAPRGTKLWTPMFGNVELLGVRYANTNAEEDHKHDCTEDFSIEYEFCANDYSFSHRFGTDPFGRLYRCDQCPCVIYLSKDCRTWENFKAPWLHKHKCFEPFQRVLVHCEDNIWRADIYSHYVEYAKKHCTIVRWWDDKDIIPYEGNEDKLGKEVKV